MPSAVAKIVPVRRLVPNAISALRFPLAALFVVVDGLAARLVVVALAGLSDWVDGPLARRLGTTSRTGAWLDPLADKAFMVTALVVLALDVGLPWWALPLLLLRDIGVVLGAAALFALGRRAAVPARRAGKWVTWLQFIAVAVLLIAPGLALWIAPLVALAGGVALVDYGRAVVRSPAVRARNPDRSAPPGRR